MYIQIHYTDRKGAGRMCAFNDADIAAKFMDNLRLPARAKDESGQLVGEVYELPPEDRIGNRKWGWWLEV